MLLSRGTRWATCGRLCAGGAISGLHRLLLGLDVSERSASLKVHHRSSRAPDRVRREVRPAPLDVTSPGAARHCMEGRDLALARSLGIAWRGTDHRCTASSQEAPNRNTFLLLAGTRYAPGYGVCCPFGEEAEIGADAPREMSSVLPGLSGWGSDGDGDVAEAGMPNVGVAERASVGAAQC